MPHILIVEDNAASLQLLEDILIRGEYTVKSARNGLEALQVARVHPPDLVISDIFMPGMDGFALCRAWVQDDQLRLIPFIFHTATYTSPEDKIFGLSLGAARYLTKPTHPADFLAIVQDVLDGAVTEPPVGVDDLIEGDVAYLEAYNAALIRKLESKVAQLEATNRALEREIDERRVAEEAQQVIATRYRTIVDTAGTIIIVLSPDHEILEFNREAERVHGRSRDVVLGDNYLDLYVPPEDHAIILAETEAVLAGESLRSIERTLWSSDGQAFIVCWNIEPLLDSRGRAIGMVVVGQDITERKQAEQAVQALTYRYELMFQKHVTIMLLIDPETGRIVDANESACAFYGYSYDELTAMRITAINVLPEAEVQQEMQRARDEKRTYFVFQHRLASGEIRDVEVRSGPVQLEDRTLLYSVVYDITERKLVEDALLASEAQHRRIFETVTDALLIADMDATIVEVNPAACDLYGYTRDELIGLSMTELIDPDYHSTLRAFVESIETEGAFSGETVDVCADGSTFHAEVRGARIEFHGEPHLLAIVRDVTHRKVDEQRRIELELEKERSHVLQQFISDASHDLRTPLTTIKANMYLLNKQSDPEKQRHYMTVLEAQLSHLERLLDDMLHMSRLDRVVEYAFEPLDLNPLVKQIVTRYKPLARSKHQDFSFTGDPALPPVQGDRIQIGRALTHLVINALQYTPEDGAIAVRTMYENGWVMVEVQDNGCGISADDLPHIFKRFFRVDKARGALEEGAGAGLGLAIAKAIVEAHQGAIDVESVLGKGSVFRFCLPVDVPEA